MAKYTLLIYGDPARWEARTEDEARANDDGHAKFREVAGDRVLGGQELEAVATATSVRGLVTADGPFLETKEVLGGFYLVEAGDLDEALDLARLLPEVHSGHGGVEVRPVLDHG